MRFPKTSLLLAAACALLLGACAGTTYLKSEVTVARAGDKSYIAECEPLQVGDRNWLHCQISDVVDQDGDSVTAVPAADAPFVVGLEDAAQSVETRTDGGGQFDLDVLTKLDPEPFFDSDEQDLCVKAAGSCIARGSRAWFAEAARTRILAKVDQTIRTGSEQCLAWIDSHPRIFESLRRSDAHRDLVACAEEELLRLALATEGPDGLAEAEKIAARLEALNPESSRLAQVRAFIAPRKRRAREEAAEDLSQRAGKLLADGDADGALKLAQECIALKPSILTRCTELRERAESMKNLRLAFSLENQAREELKARKPQEALQAAALCFEYDRTNKKCRALAIKAGAALEKLKTRKANKLAKSVRKALKQDAQARAQERVAQCLRLAPYHRGCLALRKAIERKYNLKDDSKQVWGGVEFGLSPTEVVERTQVGELFSSEDNHTYRPGDEVPKGTAELVACAARAGTGIQRPMACVRYHFKDGGLVRIDVRHERYAKGRIGKGLIARLGNRYGKPSKLQYEDFTPVEYHPNTYLVVTWTDPAATIELVCHEEEFLQVWSLRFYSAEAE